MDTTLPISIIDVIEVLNLLLLLAFGVQGYSNHELFEI